jgi:hypothetical protein
MIAIGKPKKIVLLGMMSRWPVAGVAWVTVQYLEGLRRLGYDVYYVEAHGCTQTKFMQTPEDDGCLLAAEYIERIMRRFGFADRWAYHDVHDSGRCFGLNRDQLNSLYGSAALLINLHAGHDPLPEHSATNRLVYLETDPVEVQIGLHNGSAGTEEFLKAHCAYYTWGLNYGSADCRLPVFERFPYKRTYPLVVTDFWTHEASPLADAVGLPDLFTTIGNWKQVYKEVILYGERYHWSKHFEFLKFIDLPQRTSQRFELALSGSSLDETDAAMLRANGWLVRDGLGVSSDMDDYRRYLRGSRGEFSVAKDQNVRLRSGWFSERSAQYLACGRPVIMQDTGFGNHLPLGAGLFNFLTMDEILAAVDAINGDYEKHCRAAARIARDFLNYDVVLKPMMSDMAV